MEKNKNLDRQITNFLRRDALIPNVAGLIAMTFSKKMREELDPTYSPKIIDKVAMGAATAYFISPIYLSLISPEAGLVATAAVVGPTLATALHLKTRLI